MSLLDRLNTARRIVGISTAVVAVAAFLPWVSLLGFSARGIEGDGVITLAVAIIGAGVLYLQTRSTQPGKGTRIASLVLGAIVALIGIVDMNGAASIGLYLTLLAGIAWVVGGIMDLRGTEPAEEASPAS